MSGWFCEIRQRGREEGREREKESDRERDEKESISCEMGKIAFMKITPKFVDFVRASHQSIMMIQI